MTDTLDILRNGRDDPALFDDYPKYRLRFAKTLPKIVCADGFTVSVQAGGHLYSTPRHDAGPWLEVEVGYPSARPEPWASWEQYCEEPDNPTRTVYGYVPLALVEALIEAHGGPA